MHSRFLLLALALLGCEASKPAPASPSAPGLQPVEIRFSEPGNSGVLPYAKREKVFEPELAKVNARIVWVAGPSAFSANFEAMNSGAVNASGGAISPVIGALAHGLRFRIFAIGDPSAMLQAGIIVPAGSPIHSVKDLAGRRVAVNLAAHGDYLLLKALANEGLPATAVERVAIQPPDAAAAFATGKLDAWSTFGVFFNAAVRNGARVLVHEADLGSDDVTVNAASEEVLQRNPAAFLKFIEVTNRLIAQAREHPEQFQNVFTDKGPTALSGEELMLAIEATRTAPFLRVPAERDRTRVANVAQLFLANRSIDRDIQVGEIVFDLEVGAGRAAAAR